jgi:predicted 2-oxoglutarate/Fe(II)-dependent dioxygenase YbiX
MHVPLSDDDTCEGGLLLFVQANDTIVHPKRRAGTVLAHDGRLVHGVTKLVRGVRYGLFVLRWVDE